jgi:hypothetical protein
MTIKQMEIGTIQSCQFQVKLFIANSLVIVAHALEIIFFVRHCQNFDKFDNLSKRNVKLILEIFSDLEPLGGSSNKKTLYSTRSCVIWAFFWHSWTFKTLVSLEF